MPDVTDETSPDLRKHRARMRARASRARIEELGQALDDLIKAEIADLRGAGLSYRDIGNELGKSHTWVQKRAAADDTGPSAA